MFKLDTKHKQKSFVITLLLHLTIVFLLFYLGLKTLDVEPESGIAVNFGTTAIGNGNLQPIKSIKSSPKPILTNTISSTTNDDTETPEVIEKVVSQEIEEAPVIKEKLEKKTSAKSEEVTKVSIKEPVEEKKSDETAIEKVIENKPDPKPDKSTLAILDSFVNSTKNDGEAKETEGDNKELGDKGSPEGNRYATSYYGQPGKTGLGNGIGYGLNGRGKAYGSPVEQNCNESGKVVVKIVVNRDGKVIQATPGVKGTTNSATCLLEPAKKTALTFKWKPDSNAPVKQIGFIEITFSLGE